MLQGDPLSMQRLAAHPSGLSNTHAAREIEGLVSTSGEQKETRPRDTAHRIKGTGNRPHYGNQATTFHSSGHQHSSGGRRNDYHRSSIHTSNRPGIEHPGMMPPGRNDYRRSFPSRPEQFQTQSYVASHRPANIANVRKLSAGAGAGMPVNEHQDAPGAMASHLGYYGQPLPRSTTSESWRHSKPGESSYSNGPQISRSSSLDSTSGYKSSHDTRANNTFADSTPHSRKPFGSHRSKSHYSHSSYTPVAPVMQEYAVSWGHTMSQVMPPTVYYSMQSYPTYMHAYDGNNGAIYNSPGPYSPPMSSHSQALTALDGPTSNATGLPPTTGDIGSFGGQAPVMNRLQGQLEWYFSPQNLATDAYLASKMDKDKWVPISIIAEFKKVKSMTDRIEDVVEALRRSTVVEVDGDGGMVRPILTNRPRTTLIIRELPDDTERQEIGAIFEDAECPAKSITKEVIGNLWFVEFETADQALKMLYHTRGRYLRSVPIAARLKSTILHTSRESYKSSSTQCSPIPAVALTSYSTPDFASTPVETPESACSSTSEHSPPRIWSSESESIYDEPMHRMSMPYRRFPTDEETSSQDNRNSQYSQSYVAQSPYSHLGAGHAYSRPVHPAPSTPRGYMSYTVAGTQYSLPIATSDMPGYEAITVIQSLVAEDYSNLAHMATRAAHTPLSWEDYNGQVWNPAESISAVQTHDASVTHFGQYQPAVLDGSTSQISQLKLESWCQHEVHGQLQGDVHDSIYSQSGQPSPQYEALVLRQNSQTFLQQRVWQGERGNFHSGISTSNTPVIGTNAKSGRRASKKKNTRSSLQTLDQQKPTQLSQQQRPSHSLPQRQQPQQYQSQESPSELSSGAPGSKGDISLLTNGDKPEKTSLIHGVMASVTETDLESPRQVSERRVARGASNIKSSTRPLKPTGQDDRSQSDSRRNIEKGTKSIVNLSPFTSSRDVIPFKNENFPPLPTTTSWTPGLQNAGAEGATSNISWGPSRQMQTVDLLGVEYPNGVKLEATNSSATPLQPLRDAVSNSSSPALKKAILQQVLQEERPRPETPQSQTGTCVDKSLAESSRIEATCHETRHDPEISEKTTLLGKTHGTLAPSMFSYASVLKVQQREAVVERLHVPQVQANNHSSQRLTVDTFASEAM